MIKMGTNVVTWKSMKQSEISLSSAESEVQALASTAVLADFIKTLRESLCLPTPEVELRCDNTAAITLATGEGSWRTKSAANKVYWVKERVDSGRFKVTYVSTLDQRADSLTKFLKGGQDQKRANTHLSLIELRNWTTRKGPKPRADGVHSVQKRPEVFGPKVSRVFCVEPVFSGSDVSTDFGLGSLVRRKKSLLLAGKIHIM